MRMKIVNPNCCDFKKLSLLAHIINFMFNCAYLNFFLNSVNSVDGYFEYENVSYTMVYTSCFEGSHFYIRNRSGWFCETSFLTVGLYCTEQLPDEVIKVSAFFKTTCTRYRYDHG